MKILMVNKFLYPAGGAETYMFGLGDYLKSSGHQVEYFGMDSVDRCVSNSIDCYTDNVDFRNAGFTSKIKYSLKTIYSKEAKEKIGKVLDSFKPDVVHLNNINFQLTPSIIYAIKERNIPIVQTVHDVQISCPNHRMYNEQTEKICSECFDGKYIKCTKNRCVHGSLLKSAIASYESHYYHKKDTYNLIDRYICPSQFIADVIINAGVKEDKTTVLHNYCKDFGVLPPKDKSRKYVLYFGRLSVEKGIKTLIEACRELKDIQFVFAGTGPLADLCKDIKNIEAVGFKSGDELKTLIRNATFSLCPSECNENCPMSILESSALGTPVICSRLGGAPELVTPGETGEIFTAGDKEDLKIKILKLYNNPSLVDKMSESCIKASTNTIQNYSDKLISIYQSLMKLRG
ncbi:MAG: glycosyltransferase [Eubacterium sp.]|nr:glycosyltransferase [Eubacterium sp.]